MAVDEEQDSPHNLMPKLLEDVRELHIGEHGEEPPSEFMKKARQRIVQEVAKQNREKHRDIYDALADE